MLRQLRHAALPCAALAILTLLAFETGREFDLARRPSVDGSPYFVAFAWGLAGVLLGFVAAAGDELRGARQFLLHRGLTRTRIFAAQALADFAALALALAVVVGVEGALAALRHDPLVQPPPLYQRYAELVLLSTAAVLGRGVGSLGAALRREWIVRLLSTWFGACGAIYLTHVVVSEWGDRWLSNEALWLAWTLGAGGALHALAAAAQRAGLDPERPLDGALRPLVGVAALVLAAPAALVAAGQVQRWALEATARRAPVIQASGDGVVLGPGAPEAAAPLRGVVLHRGERHDLGDVHAEASFFIVERRRRRLELGAGWRQLLSKRAWLRGATGHFVVETWIGARNGRLLVQAVGVASEPGDGAEVELAPAGLELPYRTELARADGRPFSARVILVPPSDRGDAWLLADASDRTVWKLDVAPARPTLTRLEQPEVEGWFDVDVALDREVVAQEGARTWRSSSRLALRTASGRWSWDGRLLVPAQLQPHEIWRSEAAGTPRFTLEMADDDVLAPRVIVRSAQGGELLLAHRYSAPVAATLTSCLASVLRSPVGGMASALDARPRRVSELSALRDPLVAGGRRPWLLALNAAASLALALVLARRRTLGLRVTWFVLLAVLGPLAGLMASVLEPRRRPPSPAHRPPLLIGPRTAHAPRERAAS